MSQRTTYDYEPTFGTLRRVNEYNQANQLYCSTEHLYATNTATAYILDSKQWDIVRDSNNVLAHTIYGWDGSWGPATVGTTGLVRKAYNLPSNPPQPSSPSLYHTTDTSYGYDQYGNQTTVTTYAEGGVNTNTWGPPRQ